MTTAIRLGERMKGKSLEFLLALLFKSNPSFLPSDIAALKKHYDPIIIDQALENGQCRSFLVTLCNRFGEPPVMHAYQGASAAIQSNITTTPNPASTDKSGTLQFVYDTYKMTLDTHRTLFDEGEAALSVMADPKKDSFPGPHLCFATLVCMKRLGTLLSRSCRLYRMTLRELAEPFYDPDNIEEQLQKWATDQVQSCQEKIKRLFNEYPGMQEFLNIEHPDWLTPLQELVYALKRPTEK